jgi:hypothetical protein
MQLVPKMHTRLDIEKDSLMHFAVQNGYMLPFTLHVWLSLTYGIIRKKKEDLGSCHLYSADKNYKGFSFIYN